MIDYLSKKLYWTRKIFDVTDSPFKVLLFRLGIFKECECGVRGIGAVKLTENDLKNSFFEAILYICSQDLGNEAKKTAKLFFDQKDQDIIDLKSLRVTNVGLSLIFETFVEEPYDISPTENERIIIDIGGSVGDTALYFASKGYMVYSFEPVPEVYQIALQNIGLNPHLADRITFVNKAVSASEGYLELSYHGINRSGNSSAYGEADERITVESITLERILNDYQVSNPYLLKMDCEGCEYEIINNADLSPFNEIILEYHPLEEMGPEHLIETLESKGFKLKKRVDNEIIGVGIIHAVKS